MLTSLVLPFAQTTDGLYEMLVEHRLSILGDASSVALTKVLAGKNLTADDIDRVLAVINSSFLDVPTANQEPSDRNPRTTGSSECGQSAPATEIPLLGYSLG